MKLHIGCGSDIRPGFINVDEFNPKADIRMPIQDINYPDRSVERIEGYMVIEHLTLCQAKQFVRNAYRMLAHGGILVLEMPDLEKVSRLILAFNDDPAYLESGSFGLRGIFGEPTTNMAAGDIHKWGYTASSAGKLMKEAGFRNFKIMDGTSHCYPIRDMRVEAIK